MQVLLKPSATTRSIRRGFTLLELLISISIIALLMSLILPAVLSARSSARRLQCANNLHNLAIAMTGAAHSNKRFPAAGYFGAGGSGHYSSWAVALLPWIDRADIHSTWDLNKPFDDPANAPNAALELKVLVCPDDFSALSGNGNLSYVVNSGIGWTIPNDCPASFHISTWPATQPIDLNANGVTCGAEVAGNAETDRQILKKMGLFFIENWPPGYGTVRNHSMDSVTDGLSHTLMLGENIRAGFDPSAKSGWASPDPLRNTFVMSSHVCPNGSCAPGTVDYSLANSRSTSDVRLEALNSGRTQAEGEAPWPSANHGGGLNFAFVDGHVVSISDQIDGDVYAALVTPQGGRLPSALAQSLVSDADY